MTAANDLAVRRALEMAGVEFIDENGGAPDYASASVNEQNHPNSRTDGRLRKTQQSADGNMSKRLRPPTSST
jgi:hypothetical protein